MGAGPYTEFENRVLVVGGGFAGYTVAKTLGDLTEDRDDVGVMVINKENFFTYWPMVAGIISSDVETKNVAQPLRRALIQFGASFRRAELESVHFERQRVRASGGLEFPYITWYRLWAWTRPTSAYPGSRSTASV